MSWTLQLPWLPPGLNGPQGLMRMHWSQKRKAGEAAYLLVRAALPSTPPPKPPLRLTYVLRYARQPRDLDNLAASLKLPLDALVKARALPDDNPGVVAELVLRQEKVPTVKEQGITITLEPLTP